MGISMDFLDNAFISYCLEHYEASELFRLSIENWAPGSFTVVGQTDDGVFLLKKFLIDNNSLLYVLAIVSKSSDYKIVDYELIKISVNSVIKVNDSLVSNVVNLVLHDLKRDKKEEYTIFD